MSDSRHVIMDDVEIKDQRYKCCELSGTPHDHIGMSGEPEFNVFVKEISKKNGTPRAGIEEYEARQNEIKPCAVCDTSKITRVEVINHAKGGKGREYTQWSPDIKIDLSIQDDDRTLKIFISDRR